MLMQDDFIWVDSEHAVDKRDVNMQVMTIRGERPCTFCSCSME